MYFPHRARTNRPQTSQVGAGYAEDEYGRPVAVAPVTGPVLGAWFQEKSSRERAALLAGNLRGDWTVFTQPADIRHDDVVQWLDENDNVVRSFAVEGIRDPDGLGDHLELDVVSRG